MRPGASALRPRRTSEASLKTSGSEGTTWDVSKLEPKTSTLDVPQEGRREITVTVTTEHAQTEDLEELELRTRSDGNIMTAPLRREDHMALEFQSKPTGF